jgi:hypothetical protein
MLLMYSRYRICDGRPSFQPSCQLGESEGRTKIYSVPTCIGSWHATVSHFGHITLKVRTIRRHTGTIRILPDLFYVRFIHGASIVSNSELQLAFYDEGLADESQNVQLTPLPLPRRTWSTFGHWSVIRQLVLGSWNPCCHTPLFEIK